MKKLKDFFKKDNKDKGLLWAVIITWLDFPLLYWGVNSGQTPLISLGLISLFFAAGLVLYFA